MTERVTTIDIGVVWDPNAPDAVLLTDDGGSTALALRAHCDDSDQRTVVLFWSGARYRLMGGPNDEAISGHRLYGKGLETVTWIGEVAGSELVASLEKQNSVHPQHDPARFAKLLHQVALTKEETVEVVADSLVIKRIAGSTGKAAREAVMA